MAYTFDAGPNACVYLLDDEVNKFVSYMNALYPNDELKPEEYARGLPINVDDKVNEGGVIKKNAFKYIIHTKIGDGPCKLDSSETLVNENSFPKNIKS